MERKQQPSTICVPLPSSLTEVIEKVDPRKLLAGAAIPIAIGFGLLSGLSFGDTRGDLVLPTVLFGLGSGFTMPALFTGLTHLVDPDRIGMASGLGSFSADIAAAVASAVTTVLLASRLAAHTGGNAPDLSALIQGSHTAIPPAELNAFRHALANSLGDVFTYGLVAVGVLALLRLAAFAVSHRVYEDAPVVGAPAFETT